MAVSQDVGISMPSENSKNRKLRFMELMQRCIPFKWQRYWNCGTKEFDLLYTLAQNKGLVLSREKLLDLAWGYDFYGLDVDESHRQ